MSPNPLATRKLLASMSPITAYGKVSKIVGLVAEGSGIRAPLGSLCHILPEAPRNGGRGGEEENVVPVEVVGFRDNCLLFMPYGDLRGVQPGSLVRNSSLPPFFPAGPDLLGRAFDAFGEPLVKGPPLNLSDMVALYADPPSPLTRPRIGRAQAGIGTKRCGFFSKSIVRPDSRRGCSSTNPRECETRVVLRKMTGVLNSSDV